MTVGTVRSKSALLEQFSDNNQRQITAEDCRDFIVTFFDHEENENNPHSTTASQVGAITSLSDDDNPSLGGNLDLAGFSIESGQDINILSESGANINICAAATGGVYLNDQCFPDPTSCSGAFLCTDGSCSISWSKPSCLTKGTYSLQLNEDGSSEFLNGENSCWNISGTGCFSGKSAESTTADSATSASSMSNGTEFPAACGSDIGKSLTIFESGCTCWGYPICADCSTLSQCTCGTPSFAFPSSAPNACNLILQTCGACWNQTYWTTPNACGVGFPSTPPEGEESIGQTMVVCGILRNETCWGWPYRACCSDVSLCMPVVGAGESPPATGYGSIFYCSIDCHVYVRVLCEGNPAWRSII